MQLARGNYLDQSAPLHDSFALVISLCNMVIITIRSHTQLYNATQRMLFLLREDFCVCRSCGGIF